MLVDEIYNRSYKNGVRFTATGWCINKTAFVMGNVLPGLLLKQKWLATNNWS